MSLVLFFLMIICKVAFSKLSVEQCKQYQAEDLFAEALAIHEKSIMSLKSSYEPSLCSSYTTLVDEALGNQTGGATNTFGAYSTLGINSSITYKNSGFCDTKPIIFLRPQCQGNGSATTFIIGPSDAIVVYACTPPPVEYFGYDLEIESRFTTDKFYDIFYPGQNFGDSVNYLNMNISLPGESVFDHPSVLIYTADQATANDIITAYTKLGGLDASSISVFAINADIVKFWDRSQGSLVKESRPDYLGLIGRMTAPLSGQADAFDKYKAIVWPAIYYKALSDASVPKEPLLPPLIPRFSPDLVDEVATYSAELDSLTAAVIESFESKGYTYLSTDTLNLTCFGFYDDWDVMLEEEKRLRIGVSLGQNFVLPTRDAVYGLQNSFVDGGYTFFNGRNKSIAAVLVGVVHAATLDPSYASVGASIFKARGIKQLQATETHWFLDKELAGSARRYYDPQDAPSHALASDLYAVDFLLPGFCSEKDKGQRWCVEWNQTASLDGYASIMVVAGERIYALRRTTVGPPANITLPSRLLLFNY